MNITTSNDSFQKPIRLWPGVAAVVVQWLGWFVVPVVAPAIGIYGLFAGVFCGLVVLLWWAFFSRVPHVERWGGILVIIVAVAMIPRIPGVLHESIVGGMMGLMPRVFAIPVLSLALVAWAVLSRSWSIGTRRVALGVAIVAGYGLLSLVRTDGIMGEGRAQLAWRWTKTAEQQLLAQVVSEPAAVPAAPATAPSPTTSPAAETTALAPTAATPAAVPATVETRAEWPGFRGPHRDGAIRGERIATDWSASPPVEMWRRAVGPAWSSFAVSGNLIYTQEQRGEVEVVACYNRTTGKPVWTHRDASRFYESNGGAGPRGTPTLHGGRVYALGGMGILNALDAGNGAVVWTRDAASDTGAKVPMYGFSASPLVVDDMVIVAASGRLAAYDISTGAPRWVRKEGGPSYSSPHLLTIGGVAQVLLMSGAGAISVAPADGKLLWEDAKPGGVRIVQPALAPDGNVLLSLGDEGMGGGGLRRMALAQGPGGWTLSEVWSTRGLKPDFNDFVVHNGHAFGFDGSILACIDLKDGTRKWKGGRYGKGQLILLADQDVLLVLSEEGEIALVKAATDQFTELAKAPAIEGKTWNHPVLAGNVLLVRNGQEMAAFRMALAR